MKLFVPLLSLGLALCSACGPAPSYESVDGAAADVLSASPGEQLEAYLSAEGIEGEQTTASGLVYVVEEPGGVNTPALHEDITILYKGYLVDGTVFDQTQGRSPRTFPLSQLIPAWQEGLQLIGRGGKIKLLAPPGIAYGSNPPPGTPIRANSVLVFDIELVDFPGAE